MRTPNPIEHGLEALRGFAALVVVISHIIAYGQFLDPGYLPPNPGYRYDGGHLMVLVFLVLSGFVIARSTRHPLVPGTVLPYVKKRLVRIYPIYVVSLAAALAVSATSYSVFTVLSNLAFANVFLSNVMLDNGPIWSLHYEVVFYLLFVPLSFYRVPPLRVGALAALIGWVNYFYAAAIQLPALTSYCFGFAFWTAGLALARHFSSKEPRALEGRALLGQLFLLATLPCFNFLSTLLAKASYRCCGHLPVFPYDGNIQHWFKMAFTALDFAYLPYCFAGVLVAINARFRGKRAVLLLLQLLPLFAIRDAVHHRADAGHFWVPLGCYGLSWLFFWPADVLTKAGALGVRFLAWIGGVSYGLYVVHVPLLVLFNRVPVFSGSPWSFGTRVVLYFGLAIGVAHVLEKRFQPWVKHWVAAKG